jgi:hypothetical protein
MMVVAEVEVVVDTNATWTTLQQFAEWYKTNNYPHNPPADAKLYQTDVSSSICVFRQGRFQVEFYIARPNFVSSKHYHNFEQAIIPMGGTGRGRRGTNLSEESDWKTINQFIVGKILPINYWHQIESFDLGLYFYNCQMWPEEVTPTSAVVSYIGASLGPIHDLIKSNTGT